VGKRLACFGDADEKLQSLSVLIQLAKPCLYKVVFKAQPSLHIVLCHCLPCAAMLWTSLGNMQRWRISRAAVDDHNLLLFAAANTV
jgi:hypothetical protein